VRAAGERFRLVILDVRATRVVLFLESVRLRPTEFRGFLATADRVRGESTEFPG
jgi:hypothetical protein